MKKLIYVIFIVTAMMCTCSGCNNSTAKISYLHADWPYYETTDDLLEMGTDVFEGKLVNIFFNIIDISTGKPVETVNESGRSNLFLHTVYEIETTHIYKGADTEKKYITIIGGIPEYKEKEQLKLMKECSIIDEDENVIAVLPKIKELNVGSSYLFVACDLGTSYLQVPNMDQFAFEINNSQTIDDDDIPNYANIKHSLSK